MKRMLFNATQAEELRVAIVDGQKLIDLDIESASKEQRKSNIYKGVVTRIEPSLEAAFVDYGAERHGFLPFKEISRAYFKSDAEPGRARIQDAIREGQELIVQVEKDERGNKGAALTTFISLAGRYLVLMPNNPRGGGVSRRVEGDDRAELRDVLDQLEIAGGMSLIARTAAIGRTAEELQWDLNYLTQLWRAIEGAAKEQSGAMLIYQEGSLVIRAIRDYFSGDIGELLIDTDDIYEQAKQFMAHVMPQNVHRVKRYRDDVPLFSRFQIEHQIESAYSREVALPSGGAIVIDHTEALVAIDVNSGRATRGADIEETALKTNCEAADELARQLRLRDLGGLIVIDFIDMENPRSQREVENRLRDALHFDRARVQMGKISRFGLLELSRQRLRPALAETSYITCPRCTGTGHIRSTESAALHILRILEEEAMKDNTGAVHTQVPVDVATFLLNEKRDDIAKIELRHKVNLLLIPNRHLETPQHEIVRLRHDQLNQEETSLPSYKMAVMPADATYTPPSAETEAKPARQEAAIRNFNPGQPAPIVEAKPVAKAAEPASPGIFQRIMAWLRGDEPVVEPAPAPARPARRDGRNRGERNDRNRGERGEGKSREPRKTEERNERKRGERDERPARNAQAAGRAEATETSAQKPPREGGERGERTREPRGERGERRERPPREPKVPRAPQQAVAAETEAPETELVVNGSQAVATDGAAAQAEGETNGNRRRNRRGRRGGADRGERRNGAQNENVENPVQQEIALTEASPTSEATPEPAPRQRRPRPARPVEQMFYPTPEAKAEAEARVEAEMLARAPLDAGASALIQEAPSVSEAVAPASEVAGVTAAVAPAPQATHEAVLEGAPAPAADVPAPVVMPEESAPVAAAAVPVTATVAPVKPVVPIDLAAVLASQQDLVMIETRADAPPPVATLASAAETEMAPARRRTRVVRPVVEEVMLEQVETRRE